MGSEKRCDALESNSRVNCARAQKIMEAPQKPDARTPPKAGSREPSCVGERRLGLRVGNTWARQEFLAA